MRVRQANLNGSSELLAQSIYKCAHYAYTVHKPTAANRDLPISCYEYSRLFDSRNEDHLIGNYSTPRLLSTAGRQWLKNPCIPKQNSALIIKNSIAMHCKLYYQAFHKSSSSFGQHDGGSRRTARSPAIGYDSAAATSSLLEMVERKGRATVRAASWAS